MPSVFASWFALCESGFDRVGWRRFYYMKRKPQKITVPQFKRYTEAQKRNAVRRVLSGEPFAAVVMSTHCSFKTLAYWLALAGHGPCPWCGQKIKKAGAA